MKSSKRNYCQGSWYLMNAELQMNLMLSSKTLGVNWQVKFQMVQQPSNPT